MVEFKNKLITIIFLILIISFCGCIVENNKDYAEEEKFANEIINKALNESNVSLCEKIPHDYEMLGGRSSSRNQGIEIWNLRNICYKKVAEKLKNISICEKLEGAKCHYYIEGTTCYGVTFKNECYYNIAIENKNSSICNFIEETVSTVIKILEIKEYVDYNITEKNVETKMFKTDLIKEKCYRFSGG